jgi:putative transposase
MSGNRIHHPDLIHLVSSRTIFGMFLITPTPKITKIVSYWFARSLNEYAPNIEIYAFMFMSNHFHILLRDPAGELPVFMREFKGRCARSVNRALGRRDLFWPGEYDDTIIVGDEAFTAKLAYVLCNPVKDGLVMHAKNWRGANSLKCHLGGRPFAIKEVRQREYYAAQRHGRRANREDYSREYSVQLTPPPMWSHLRAHEVAEKIDALVKSASANYRLRWRRSGPVGMVKILRQNPYDAPRRQNVGAPADKEFGDGRFRCKDKAQLKALKEWLGEWMGRYREAFRRFAAEALKPAQKRRAVIVQWPPGMYPPSSIRPVCWA